MNKTSPFSVLYLMSVTSVPRQLNGFLGKNLFNATIHITDYETVGTQVYVTGYHLCYFLTENSTFFVCKCVCGQVV